LEEHGKNKIIFTINRNYTVLGAAICRLSVAVWQQPQAYMITVSPAKGILNNIQFSREYAITAEWSRVQWLWSKWPTL